MAKLTLAEVKIPSFHDGVTVKEHHEKIGSTPFRLPSHLKVYYCGTKFLSKVGKLIRNETAQVHLLKEKSDII